MVDKDAPEDKSMIESILPKHSPGGENPGPQNRFRPKNLFDQGHCDTGGRLGVAELPCVRSRSGKRGDAGSHAD